MMAEGKGERERRGAIATSTERFVYAGPEGNLMSDRVHKLIQSCKHGPRHDGPERVTRRRRAGTRVNEHCFDCWGMPEMNRQVGSRRSPP